MTTTPERDGTDRQLDHLRGMDALRELGLQRLGDAEPDCVRCGETDPLCLQLRGADEVLCYECAAVDAGRSPTENHHVAGQLNSSDTITVTANDHRTLSAAQSLWPPQTLRNPNQSLLLTIAAILRGWLDLLRHFINSVGWIPEKLEALDDHLTHLHGPSWWQTCNEEQP